MDLLIDFSEKHPLFKQQYLHICTVKDEVSMQPDEQSIAMGRTFEGVKREIQDVEKRLKGEMTGLKEIGRSPRSG